MAFSFARLRFFSSPSGHRWQCAHFCAFWQPPGLWNQAHGRHVPVPCRVEPREGICPEEDAEEAAAGVTSSSVTVRLPVTVLGSTTDRALTIGIEREASTIEGAESIMEYIEGTESIIGYRSYAADRDVAVRDSSRFRMAGLRRPFSSPSRRDGVASSPPSAYSGVPLFRASAAAAIAAACSRISSSSMPRAAGDDSPIVSSMAGE
mmetsp:Transcript_75574/g.197041  ORF Transcript_75574/g.197041 Transcript_75574/m.197041 type:complete len:206 (-) Transcript_75574:314-931(-)